MLLNSLNVRTKILSVLLPLVAVIIALAGFAVTDRLDRADDAAGQVPFVDLTGATTELAVTHAGLAIAAMEGVDGDTADAVAARTAFANAVVEAGTEDSTVAAVAAGIDGALASFDQAIATATTWPGPETRALLAESTTDLFDAIESVTAAASPHVDAGGASLEPADAQLAVHDAIVILGTQLAATEDLRADEVDAAAVGAASERLDAALVRAEVYAVDEGPDLDAVRKGALSPDAVADALAGNGPQDDLASEVEDLAEPFGVTAADEVLEQRTVVADARDAARGAATTFTLGSALALLLALGAALVVTRSITDPLKELTDSTYEIATQRLPRLVDRLRAPEAEGVLTDELVPITVRSEDEIGQLAAAFNTMQKVTGEVAEQQAVMLRKGISDLFVNLARRNQALLDRQIEFIDQLEAHEEDPEQLQNLFRLDHLATRMRRNAESLLVLAGAEPGRRRGRPVALTDVVRIAIGEVEHFARIAVVGLEDVQIRSTAAVDLAHLLAELMDNATNYSPPDSRVEVVGRRIAAQSYLISVTDRGIGMSEKQLAEVNALLNRPPAMGLALSRSLGLTVVARLAHRHGIAARIIPGEDGGVIAQVHLPGEVFDELPPPELVPNAPESPFVRVPTDAVGALWGRSAVTAAPPPATLAVAAAAAEATEDLLPEVEGSVRASAAAVSTGEDGSPEAGQAPAAPAAFGSAAGLMTTPPAAGAELGQLPQRRGVEAAPAPTAAGASAAAPPTATPQELGLGPAVAPAPASPLPTRSPLPERQIVPMVETGPGLASSAVAAAHRSPEEVRRMLSRYRSGLRRGQVEADTETADSITGAEHDVAAAAERSSGE